MLDLGRTQGDAEVLKIDFIKYNKTYIQEWVPSLRDPRHHLPTKQMRHLFINSAGSNVLPENHSGYNRI